MEKLYIIDASGYLYSSYFAIRNMTNGKGESTNALFGFIRSTLKLIKDFNPQHLVAVFDGPNNTQKRKALYSEYKAHRQETPQDLRYQIPWARMFCELLGIPYLNITGAEADDAMGAVAHWAKAMNSEVYICSTDKDLYQLVDEKTFILNTRKDNLIIDKKGVEELFGVPPHLMIDLLAMIGDSSDNVPGIPGIGPKTASTLLNQFGSLKNLLSQVNEVTEKKRKLIVENQDKALLSQKLVTIDLDIPIPADPSFYSLKAPKATEIKEFYLSMSFHSLIREFEAQQPQQLKQAEFFQTEIPFENAKNYSLIEQDSDLKHLISFLSDKTEISFAVEGSHTNPFLAQIIGISLGIGQGKAWYIPFNGPLDPQLILENVKPLFENPKISFFGHEIKYDYHLLFNQGIEIANCSFDVSLASYLLNSHNRQHTLNQLCLQYFGKVRPSMAELTGKGRNEISIVELPLKVMCAYCCEDVDYTWQLKQLLAPQLKERGLEHLLKEIELPLLKVLAKMEKEGIFLDQLHLKNMSKEIQSLIEDIQKEIFTQAGEVFNLNSPKQLTAILLNKFQIILPKKTATGYSTNAEILEDLKEIYPIAGVILEYRTLEKLRSTYLENLPKEVNSATGRIHCTFNQTVTATGRLSCQDPNLQNIPIRTPVGRKIREAFRPQKENWSYLAADYSQIELRLLAHFSEDPLLIEAFMNNEDIHTSTAATIFTIPKDQVTSEQRYRAKAVNFGILYGQQAFGLAKELKIEVKEAAEFIDVYFKKYSKVKNYIEMVKDQARATGKAITYTGRERLIPEIHSKNAHLRAFAERLAVNTPIQGTAADLIKLAMLAIEKKFLELQLKGFMILQIHDELIFEIPDNEIEVASFAIREAMQNVFAFKIPLIVNITLGKNWKEC